MYCYCLPTCKRSGVLLTLNSCKNPYSFQVYSLPSHTHSVIANTLLFFNYKHYSSGNTKGIFVGWDDPPGGPQTYPKQRVPKSPS